jgi:hypothetical protein
MFLNRTFFALVFASAALLYTAIWGQQGLTIDPDGAPRAAATSQPRQDTPLFDQGLTIDPDGRQ